jgi:hypothetical protein
MGFAMISWYWLLSELSSAIWLLKNHKFEFLIINKEIIQLWIIWIKEMKQNIKQPEILLY